MPYENNEDKFIKAVSKRIRKLRTDKKWSQEKLADMLYVERKSISHYETGQTELPIHLLYRYVEIFGVTADYILFGEDSRTINKQQLIDYIMGH